MNTIRQSIRRGFTLIEIMVVLMIISVLIAFTIPAIGPALNGSKLKQAADAIEGVLSVAKQVAITESETVQVRFLKYADASVPGGEEEFRAVQAVIVKRDPLDHTAPPLEVRAVTNAEALPVPYIISSSTTFSSLIDGNQLQKGIMDAPRADDSDWVGFEFRPDGRTNLTKIAQEHWTITIVDEKFEQASLPAEYITLMLDPYNGQVRRFQ